MRPENAIEVKDLHKSFKIYYDKGGQLKERMLFWKRNRFERRHVLKGISFEVKKGEAVGLIGHNGCGKSTTLKLLTRIIYPDSGSIEMQGRVASLIELGAGFHPDMSGRENIYINAAIFGLSKKEIDARLEGIIAFSELEEFIDNPVRTYSSGMYMRLAFSVAINVDADILLVDEILAVGDAMFQSKCFNRLRQIKEQGTTIIIVSHSMGQIEQICDRSIWIQDGEIRADGAPRDVDPQYMEHVGRSKKTENTKKEENRWGNGMAAIESVQFRNAAGEEADFLMTGEDASVLIKFHVNEPIRDAVFGIGIFRNDGLQCYGTNTRIDRLEKFDLLKDGEAEIRLKGVNLMKGSYTLDIAIEHEQGLPVDYFRNALSFDVVSKTDDVGVVKFEHEWSMNL